MADERPVGDAGAFGLRILNVSEATRAVQVAVRSDDQLRDLWVEGEVGRVTVSSAGHAYFSIRDERAQLACVWFRDDRLRSAFQPQPGLRIVVHGRVDFYDAQGLLQVYVESVQPSGIGDLAVRFEQLKARLAGEGLFDPGRKRPLPVRPAAIAVVTSPTGAVWHDICHVLARRWPLARVLLVPCQVQGDAAPASIVAGLQRLATHVATLAETGQGADAPAVTILARGGGSLEDLWAFNDEAVVRAIVAHPLPVISGVGHEVDVTLADFAADVRAPTPSAAAELAVPDRTDFLAALARGADRMHGAVARTVAASGRELAVERRMLDRLHPAAQLAAARERTGDLLDRATRAAAAAIALRARQSELLGARLAPTLPSRLRAGHAALDGAAGTLRALGPEATLERGYAIVRRRADGAVVRVPADAPAGAGLAIRVGGGTLDATVDT